MSNSKSLKSFKKSLITNISKSQKLPIVASIGKQSKGKSCFLGHFLSDPDIPNKQGEFIQKGTLNLFSKSYEDLGFTLFDMEGLESKENESIKDSLNFCTVFTISDIILLNISHDDLENEVFTNIFAYNYWRFCITSLKHRQRKLSIILCIRDPRWSGESIKILDSYNNLVREFSESVNQKLHELTDYFIRMTKVFVYKDCANPDGFCATNTIYNFYSDYLKACRFTIDEHFAIYFKKSLERNTVKYFELERRDNEDARFKKGSKFDSMMRFITQKCCDIITVEKIRSEFEFNECNENQEIRNMIEEEKVINMSIKNIVEGIYFETVYDPIMHYHSVEGLVRFMENYYKLYKKIHGINEEIVYNISKEIITENNFLLYKKQYKKKLSISLKELNLCKNDTKELKSYFKFLSAKSYIEALKLNKENPERISYQTLMFIIKYSSYQEIISHQLKELSKRRLIFKCNPYNDIDFQEMIHTLYKNNIYIYQSLYDIYQDEVIKKSCDFSYEYVEVLDTELNSLESQISFQKIFELFDTLLFEYNEQRVREFLRILMEIHRKKLTNMRNSLSQFAIDKFKPIIEKKFFYEHIPALYMPEKVFPSFFGLLISILNHESRTNLLKTITATKESKEGWTVFGKTNFASYSWAISSAFSLSSTKWIGFKKCAQTGYKISNMINNCDLVNGNIVDFRNNADKDFKKHETWYKVEHFKVDYLTLCIKVTFYSMQSKV